MTKLNWNRGRHGGGYSVERSPYRPFTPTELLRGRVQRKPAPATSADPMTLAALERDGINRLSIWCRTCQTTEQRVTEILPADIRSTPIDRLADAMPCETCGGATAVSAYTEGPAKHVGPPR